MSTLKHDSYVTEAGPYSAEVWQQAQGLAQPHVRAVGHQQKQNSLRSVSQLRPSLKSGRQAKLVSRCTCQHSYASCPTMR